MEIHHVFNENFSWKLKNSEFEIFSKVDTRSNMPFELPHQHW